MLPDHIGGEDSAGIHPRRPSDAGWVVPPGGTQVDATFALAGTSLGISRSGRPASPVWLDLYDLVGLDALGEPAEGMITVEITMADGSVIGAGWTEAFCDSVLEVLTRTSTEPRPATTHETEAPRPANAPVASSDDTDLAARGAPTGGEPAADPAASPFSAGHVPGADVRFDEVEPSGSANGVAESPLPVEPPATESSAGIPPDTNPPDAELPAVTPPADAPLLAQHSATATPGVVESSTSLELEDVVYLGGYPGQTRRRKRCTVSMTRSGLELDGPSDLRIRIAWESVKTVEVQNSDEARFRMNTKIHRDASALVVECEQGVTVLLEARDCPTLALRSAITQLMTDLPVVVV